MTDSEFWKKKLMAFLHDPPCKPLDISGHEKVGQSFIRRAGLDTDDMRTFDRQCDWTAAAADRFSFPDPAVLSSGFAGTSESPFCHPLGGSRYCFAEPFSSSEKAEEIFQVIQNGISVDQVPEPDRDWANFFLHWRRWPCEAAKLDSRSYFLPADTRIPDHNTWSHNSLVSALQGCVIDGRLAPAFLLFQLGPVQSFIEQARSTRDLWSGSYLISWLMAHAIKTVTDEAGPDSVIFPALRGQPLFDLLHRDRLYRYLTFASGSTKPESLWERMRQNERDMLTPNLPNRFLAVLPAKHAERLAHVAEQAVAEELKAVADACWRWFETELPLRSEWRLRYDEQIQRFPQIAWHVTPWATNSIETNLSAFRELCPYRESPAERLRAVHDLATKQIPVLDRDNRNFDGQVLKNPGFCWPYHYALADWLLAARRNTRDFQPWTTDDNQTGAVKDSFSGLEEVIGSESWWENARKHPELRFCFRSDDRLGAMNLIKRVWHRAYLKDVWNLNVGSALAFESVPGVAAGKWRESLASGIRQDSGLFQRVSRARQSILRHAKDRGVVVSGEADLELWITATDPECFGISLWERESDGLAQAGEVIEALSRMYEKKAGSRRLLPPPGYYAVIAFDGDEMGKWVSGEKTPDLTEQLSKEAAEYFRETCGDQLKPVHRPLSPSYHLQFSEALGNFGLHIARPVVEHFCGQIIYSGGDDVLAMVPAAFAFDCAEALCSGFRGQQRLAELVPDVFEVHGSGGGFVRLKHPLDEQPSWPLIVPGPRANASAGISIGHIRAPLQNMIRAARSAEARAKQQLGRAACAVSLYKRSGEILEWGFKWQSGALELYRLFLELSSGDDPPLPSRFGYALNEFLAPYHPNCEGGPDDVAGFPVAEVISTELKHVLGRQGRKLKPEQEQEFLAAADRYVQNLIGSNGSALVNFPMLFNVANFINRGEA